VIHAQTTRRRDRVKRRAKLKWRARLKGRIRTESRRTRRSRWENRRTRTRGPLERDLVQVHVSILHIGIEIAIRPGNQGLNSALICALRLDETAARKGLRRKG
jgi:sRNA-binding protein